MDSSGCDPPGIHVLSCFSLSSDSSSHSLCWSRRRGEIIVSQKSSLTLFRVSMFYSGILVTEGIFLSHSSSLILFTSRAKRKREKWIQDSSSTRTLCSASLILLSIHSLCLYVYVCLSSLSLCVCKCPNRVICLNVSLSWHRNVFLGRKKKREMRFKKWESCILHFFVHSFSRLSSPHLFTSHCVSLLTHSPMLLIVVVPLSSCLSVCLPLLLMSACPSSLCTRVSVSSYVTVQMLPYFMQYMFTLSLSLLACRPWNSILSDSLLLPSLYSLILCVHSSRFSTIRLSLTLALHLLQLLLFPDQRWIARVSRVHVCVSWSHKMTWHGNRNGVTFLSGGKTRTRKENKNGSASKEIAG